MFLFILTIVQHASKQSKRSAEYQQLTSIMRMGFKSNTSPLMQLTISLTKLKHQHQQPLLLKQLERVQTGLVKPLRKESQPGMLTSVLLSILMILNN